MAVIAIAIALAGWYQFSPAAPAPLEPNLTGPAATPSAGATVSARATATPTLSFTPTATPRSKKSTAVPTATPTIGPVVHVVRSGEMLLAIAYEYDTSVEKIMMVNEITDPTTIQIGQQLLIPVTATPPESRRLDRRPPWFFM
ncbi:MAG: LysM peptidoglycan-binding domain-containing protein [Anaerolineales bacterium]|nr:LysM peptidoglycan-binding domain-containing protein [Anaerolineales bacterium]